MAARLEYYPPRRLAECQPCELAWLVAYAAAKAAVAAAPKNRRGYGIGIPDHIQCLAWRSIKDAPHLQYCKCCLRPVKPDWSSSSWGDQGE